LKMKYILSTYIIVGSFTCFGQYHAPVNASTNSAIHFQNRPYGFITSFPPAPQGVDGNFYLHNEWNRADIFMTDSTKLSDLNIKIDLKANNIEIEYNNAVKVLPVSRVLAVKMTQADDPEEYINGSTLGGAENVYKNQFLQVLYQDTVMLLCKFYHEIIRGTANPNPALHIGKQDDKIILKKTYVIAKGDAMVASASGKSKFREEMMIVFGKDVKPLLEHINIKKEKDLTELVVKLNESL
jgi:hypothetical protein